ncbi:MAG: hypothetical protein HC787_09030 [Nostocaceae cyanobacterium CSU_2_110]|nr:hypothetical protein [Nostocaceae cyanobacterium CSU_2_110]
MSMLEASLETLKGLFADKPEALKVFDLESLESQFLKEKLRKTTIDVTEFAVAEVAQWCQFFMNSHNHNAKSHK